MIIKAIKQLFETQTTLLQKKAGTFDVECLIDEEPVECQEFKEPYLGVPAPVMTPTDEWFTDSNVEPVKTEKQITHEEMLEEAFRREEENLKEETKEPDNIHQLMYEMATQNWNTVAETQYQGGSENFQEGPGGWNSGTGHNQFRP